MITIIHGNDQLNSRNKLIEFSESYIDQDKISLDGSKLNLNTLLISLETHSIFASKKLVVVENFLSSKAGPDKKRIIDYILKAQFESDLLFWESKELDKLTLNKFSRAKIISCPLPKLMFRFLESIGVLAQRELLTMFHLLLSQQEVNFVFVMIIRQWHYLLAVSLSDNGNSLNLPSWQTAKYRNQARFLGKDKIIASYRQLIAIDYKIKTGQTPLTLREMLDIFLVNL